MSDLHSPALREVALIRNPNARRSVTDVELALPFSAIARLGWNATIEDTAGPGHATELARAAAAAGADAVIACGGDGTLNEVANGLVGTDTALGLLPRGTANVWARELEIEGNPMTALGLLATGRLVRIDTGVVQIGDGARRHFLMMCSAGIDVKAVEAVDHHPRVKRLLGRAAFAWPGLRSLFVGPLVTAIVANGEQRTVPLLMALAGNTRLYGSVIRLTNAAVLDDGELDLVTLEDVRAGAGARVVHRGKLLARVSRGRPQPSNPDGLEYVRVTEAELRPAGPLPVQVDGEFMGVAGPDSPLRLWCAPRSLTVLVPAGANPLFSGDGGC